MQTLQYDRQKLYFKWALVASILALTGYSVFFEYYSYVNGAPVFRDNMPFYVRLALLVYLSGVLIFIDKIPMKIFYRLGFLIALPVSWSVSIICFFTVGYEGTTVTGFIFIILLASILFDFTLKSFSIALFLILAFHFTLLSFYPEEQTDGLIRHIFLLGLSGILGLITNYLINNIKDSETRVLKERELLLKEIHHRVKNNMQIISSLLNLQSGSIHDESTKEVVREGQNRVKSMALIHQLLYQSDMFTSIDFSKYLDQLMASLQNTYYQPGKKIKYHIAAKKVNFDIDTAIPLGLITNELATNAYKYAFKNRKEGTINIILEKNDEMEIQFRIRDNGQGLPADFNPEKTNSLGLKLVKLLSRQIKAQLNYEVNNGTEFRLVFTENK